MTKKILFLSRTPSIFSYYKSTIEELCLRGNMVEVCFLNYDDTSPNGSRYYFDTNAENKEIIIENELRKMIEIKSKTLTEYTGIMLKLIAVIQNNIMNIKQVVPNNNFSLIKYLTPCKNSTPISLALT